MTARNRTAATRRRHIAALMLGTALAGLSHATARADSFWSGGAGDWFDAGNWAGGVPGAGDIAIVNNGGTAQIGAAGALSSIGSAGETAGNSGTVEVDGAGSTWAIGNTLYVGNSGTGTLNVTNGGAVSNHNGAIGTTATGSGTATIDGAGSTWTNSGQLTIGELGAGILDIASGGVVSNTFAIIANQAGSSGDVTVDGTGSEWNFSSNLAVGNSGDATLAISGGGAVSNVDGLVGYFAAGSSAVTVDGADSAWTNSGELYIGVWGGATLDIADGGSVSNTTGYVGRHATGAGEVTVTGAGSAWTNSGQLYVGNSGAGTLDISDGGTVEVAGGAGAVRIADQAGSTGTLNIGAASGDAAVAAGTLAAASVVFGAGDGTLVFNHTDNDHLFAAGISGAGEVLVENGETILTAAATHTGGTTISGGTLQLGNGGTAGSVSGDIANDGTLVIDRSNALTWAGVLSGAGDFRQAGAGATTLTGDSSTFAGATFVDAGALIVNGLLGGTLNVADARLGGAGTLAATTLGAGAILAPGNSIGTLNVSGTLDFASGSTYEVEVNDGGNTAGVNNDWLHATGAATIDGGASVHVTPENGTDDGATYAPGTIYTILTADGGITGTFGTVTDNFAFLNSLLSYDANNVYLTLNIAADFQDVAVTPNQQGVASTVQTFGPGNPLYDALLGLTEDQARSAFNSLSGEVHASSSTAQFLGVQQIRQQILDRLARIFGGGFGGFGTAAAKQAPAAGDAPAPGHAVWGQLFGSWGKTDGNAVTAAIGRDSYGFIGGADREIADGLRAGIALGYSRAGYDVKTLGSSADSDNFHIAGYAGTTLGNVALKGILSYAYGRTEAERTVIVGGLTNNLSADYATHTFQAGMEAGYDLDWGTLTLTPFAGLAAVHVETEGFTETGGTAALTFGATGNTTGVSTLGLRARRETGQVALSGALAWRHAFGDVDPASRAAFASAPATTFAVRGAPVAENTLALDAAVAARLDATTTLTFGYAGEYASGARDHGLRAELRIEF
ncbi:MAG: autotransporter domain-containing protein [Parvibaculum sp.]|uniref:autotransporter outer membrane beta-barrel domain-containing protein n=1 Tax=Parvibaculum sp. TaxID=2024848 RepID=UPI00271A7C5D|nr:autotransporter domain-containing protein [Parvibaculum sp.]MDO8837501.1 autotransporter domain-containing protein [Parvibaculum sp.]